MTHHLTVGSLQKFLPRWASMTENPLILDLLAQGYKMELSDLPPERLCNKPAKGHNKGPIHEEPVGGSDATGSCDSGISRGTLSGFLFPYFPRKETVRKLSSHSQL